MARPAARLIWVVSGFGLVILFVLAFIFINRLRLERANAALVAALLAEGAPGSGGVFSQEELEGLPEPVRRYLAKAVPEGRPRVTTVRLRRSGDFRLGDQSSAWKPFEAVQHFTVNPPGFVWDARIEVAPLIAVRVVDLYRAGAGALRVKALSTVAVADQQGGPELNSGELMRFLAECVWFPTALAPGQGIEWSPIDARSDRATLEDRGTP